MSWAPLAIAFDLQATQNEAPETGYVRRHNHPPFWFSYLEHMVNWTTVALIDRFNGGQRTIVACVVIDLEESNMSIHVSILGSIPTLPII